MYIARDGFIRWFLWAFFSLKGRIKRLPYVGGFLCLVLVARIYVNVAAQAAAVYIAPPPDGGVPSAEYVLQLATSTTMVPFLLPICYIYIALDLKRMRSIGLPLYACLILAGIFSALTPFMPFYAPEFAQMVVMTTFAFRAILAVIPAHEDRISPYERKFRTWQAIVTGDGTPRRLGKKDIKHWRLIKGPETKRKKKKSN